MGFFTSLFGRNWRAYKKKGDKLFQEERWGEARAEYQEALRLFVSKTAEDSSDKLAVEERLGIVHHHLVQLHMGLADKTKAGDPRKAIQHLQNALNFANQEQKKDLLERLRELETLSRPIPALRRPTKPAATPNEQAEEVFNVLLAGMDDTRADVYEAQGGDFRLGYLALMQGRLEEAERYLVPIQQNDPDNVYLQYEVGRLRLAQGRFQEAEALFEKAAPRAPDMIHLRHSWVEALWGMGNYEKAERVVEDAFSINDTMLENFLLAGRTCLRSGEFENGAEIVQEGLSIHPKSLSLYRLLGKLHTANESARSALDAFESALRLHWNYNYEKGILDFDQESAFLAGSLYLQHKINPARAEELFRALLVTPNEVSKPIFLSGAGQAILLQGRQEEARSFLIQASAGLPKGTKERTRVDALLEGL